MTIASPRRLSRIAPHAIRVTRYPLLAAASLSASAGETRRWFWTARRGKRGGRRGKPDGGGRVKLRVEGCWQKHERPHRKDAGVRAGGSYVQLPGREGEAGS